MHLPVDSPPSGLDEASCHVGEAHLAKEIRVAPGQKPARNKGLQGLNPTNNLVSELGVDSSPVKPSDKTSLMASTVIAIS